MATELTLILRFEYPWDMPTPPDLEDAYGCDVIAYEYEEV